MPVLKSQLAPPAMKEAIVLDLGDLGAQAAMLRQRAEAQAEAIVAQAKAEGERLAAERVAEADRRGHAEGLERGLAEGREQGRAEALAAAKEELDGVAAAWSSVASSWDARLGAMEREARESVLSFALQMAEKIVHRVIAVDDNTAVRQVDAALERVLANQDVRIRLHPDDRARVEEALPGLVAHAETLGHITLADDAEVDLGGCVLSVPGGEVDATIQTQLDRIAELILPGDATADDGHDQGAVNTAAADDAASTDSDDPPGPGA